MRVYQLTMVDKVHHYEEVKMELISIIILRLKENPSCVSMDIDELASYVDATSSPICDKWLVAIHDKMSTMAKNIV